MKLIKNDSKGSEAIVLFNIIILLFGLVFAVYTVNKIIVREKAYEVLKVEYEHKEKFGEYFSLKCPLSKKDKEKTTQEKIKEILEGKEAHCYVKNDSFSYDFYSPEINLFPFSEIISIEAKTSKCKNGEEGLLTRVSKKGFFGVYTVVASFNSCKDNEISSEFIFHFEEINHEKY